MLNHIVEIIAVAHARFWNPNCTGVKAILSKILIPKTLKNTISTYFFLKAMMLSTSATVINGYITLQIAPIVWPGGVQIGLESDSYQSCQDMWG